LERKALDLTPAGKREVGDPAGKADGGRFFHVSENNLPPSPRGKQVPGAEINGQIWLCKKEQSM
jgi:hypothetical protein